jgi:spermidine/putrescine transport system ATP-binding protein
MGPASRSGSEHVVSAYLEFQEVSKQYGALKAVDRVSLDIRRGEFYSLLGPSGCGKTTLLRMLAGFESPDAGRVFLDGRDITDAPPHERKVNTIFQNYALFPHLTVWENIAFGLRVARRSAADIRREVEAMLALVQMEEHAYKKPGLISGGQKQRVAIARALVMKPQVLLLDEPLAALDLKLRQRMLLELDQIHDEVGITFVYVTHDQGEAMSLSDRIAVMNAGHIEQIGTPAEIYEAPRSSFVAAFIGDTNFFEGQVTEMLEDDFVRLSVDGFPRLTCYNDNKLKEGDLVYLSIRPEKFRIAREQPPPAPHTNSVRGVVEDMIYLGSVTKYRVRVQDYRIAVHRQHSRFLLDENPITWNDEVWISWHGDDSFMLERYRAADEALVTLPDNWSAAPDRAAGSRGPA